MSRHRSRLTRADRTATTMPPTPAAIDTATGRARARLLARLRREVGRPLSDAEERLLDDQAQAGRDLETWRRDVRSRGLDPDQEAAATRARLLKRAGTDPHQAPPTGRNAP